MGNAAGVIVVGLGAMGSAALYQAAKLGARVIGIDRFSPPHDRGSSHGDTRITGEANRPAAVVAAGHPEAACGYAQQPRQRVAGA